MTLSAQGLQSAVGSPRGLPGVPARCGVQTLPEGRCPCQLRLTPRQGCPLKRVPCTPPNRRYKLHIARPRAQREGSFIPLRLLSPKVLRLFGDPTAATVATVATVYLYRLKYRCNRRKRRAYAGAASSADTKRRYIRLPSCRSLRPYSML